MSRIILKRWYNEDCTIGRVYLDDFQCFSLELPNRGNLSDVSCIPEGSYEYFFRQSPANGEVLQLRDTEPRKYIQIHAGNYTSQIKGCILVGNAIKWLNSDLIPDVTKSRATLHNLMQRAGASGVIDIYS